MTNYIILQNAFMTLNHELKLTEDELYLYSYLWTRRTYDQLIVTSLDILTEEVLLLKKKKQNKSRVQDTLNELKAKELLQVEEKGKCLTISFTPYKEKGYIKVAYETFASLDPTSFYVHVAIAKWPDGAKYAYSVWAELLNCTERHAMRILQDAVEAELIYKLEGGYREKVAEGRKQRWQETNTYSIKPFSISEIQPVSETRFTKPEEQMASVMAQTEFPDYKVGNWFDSKAFPTTADYEEFVFREEQAAKGNETAQAFVAACEKRMERLLTISDKVREIVTNSLEKARADRSTYKINNQKAEAWIDQKLAELNGEVSYDFLD